MKKEGFLYYLLKKKYRKVDFAEALLLLPFGYGIIRLIAGKFDVLTLILVGLLILVYIPTVYSFLGWRRSKE